MSLVAYDSSDEGSENEENESAEAIDASKTNNDTTETIIVQMNSKLTLPAPKVVLQSTNDKEENNDDTKDNLTHFLDLLPRPKDFHSKDNIEEDEDDILLKKKVVKPQIVKPAKKQTVKISVPSLSEFQDLEEEEDEKKPTKNIISHSQKGCGLFALLVPPRETTSNKILIPQAVKNAATKANIQQPKITKSTASQNNPKIKKPTLDKSYNELSSDDEEDTIDFFGLTASKNIPDSSVSELLDQELSIDDNKPSNKTLVIKHMEDHTISNSSSVSSDTLTHDQSSNPNKILTSNVINLPKEEILLKNKAEVGPKLPVPEQEYNVDVEGNVAFDEKAIEYLCGKRGVKRKEIDGADIIEISGEDIKPDEREWLVKALTEEPVQRPISMQSYGINSQSKKKHQITYLAHQAKAMELELKNQWSQNRMARKQAKSKYGF